MKGASDDIPDGLLLYAADIVWVRVVFKCFLMDV